MEKLKNLGLVVGAFVILVLGGMAFSKSTIVEHTNTIQAGAAGSDFYSEIGAHNNITVGGGDLATSSQGTATYTASNIVNSRVIQHTATAALTVTLPTNASLSSAGFIPNPGDTKTLYIVSSTTKITLAGNTGVQLYSASTTLDVPVNLAARLDFIRLAATSTTKVIQVIMSVAGPN